MQLSAPANRTRSDNRLLSHCGQPCELWLDKHDLRTSVFANDGRGLPSGVADFPGHSGRLRVLALFDSGNLWVVSFLLGLNFAFHLG